MSKPNKYLIFDRPFVSFDRCHLCTVRNRFFTFLQGAKSYHKTRASRENFELSGLKACRMARSKKAIASLKASQKAAKVRKKPLGGHNGKYGFLPESPLLKKNNFKRISKQKIFFDDSHSVEIFRKHPIVIAKATKKEENVSAKVSESKLEKKYQAILHLHREKSVGEKKISNKKTEEIAKLYDIGTGRNLRRIANRSRNQVSLIRQEGSGRPATVSNRKEIIYFMQDKAKEWDYEFTQRAMTDAIKEKFDVGSRWTVRQIMQIEEWVKSKKYIKPYLTKEHELDRLTWSKNREKFDFFSPDKVVVHIDEKYFYAFRTGKVIYYPPDCEPPATTALSKTQIPKVMFFGAVAPPNKAENFDGRIGLWMVSETKTAKNKSKFHEPGEEYEINAMMNGELFVDMCQNLLIPAIQKKLKFAKIIEVQMDSAGGHKIKSSVDELNQYCQSKKAYKNISFIIQPTRSPDLNVLDLGIWNSIQSGVPTIKYDENSSTKMIYRIRDQVLQAWEDYDACEKLNKIFNTLTLIYKEVIKAEGGNNFKLPHARNYQK